MFGYSSGLEGNAVIARDFFYSSSKFLHFNYAGFSACFLGHQIHNISFVFNINDLYFWLCVENILAMLPIQPVFMKTGVAREMWAQS